MSHHEHKPGCMSCSFSRRQFVTAGASAVAAAAGVTAISSNQPVFAQGPGKKLKIRVFFAIWEEVQDNVQIDWPGRGYDFRPVLARYKGALESVLSDYEFVYSIASNPDAVNQILAEDGDSVHGYILFGMNNGIQLVGPLQASGRPTLYCDYHFGGCGQFLIYTAHLLRAKIENVGFIASSQLADILVAAKCFDVIAKGGTPKEFTEAVAKVRQERTKPYNERLKIIEDKVDCLSPKELLEKLKGVKLLVVGNTGQGFAGSAKEAFGMEIIDLSFGDLNDAWNKALEEKTEALKVANRWKKEATTVEAGIDDEELFKSAAMYLAEKSLLDQHGAFGITINCLGGFYGGHIFAYPCLGFFELNNTGKVGVCESDVRSALTHCILTTLTKGRPCFVSDPILDVSTRQIIYAHCVAPTRMLGLDGPANGYEILRHAEDRQGACVRSLTPTRYMTTTIEIDTPSKRILFHQGVAVSNSYSDEGCRTKICAEIPGDFEKLHTQWDHWGWHRVTVFGDLKKEIFELADAIGFTIVEEA